MPAGWRKRRTHDVGFYVPSVTPLLVREALLPAGGAETQTLLDAQALGATGVAVSLAAFRANGLDVPTRVNDVDVVLRPPHMKGRGLPGKIQEICRIWQAVGRLDAHVVVVRSPGFHVGVVAAVAGVRGRKMVFWSASLADFDEYPPGLVRRDRRLYRLGLRFASLVVVQTHEQAEACVTRFGRGATVIGNAVESHPMPTTRPEAFLWVGRAINYKNPLAFIDLARRLPDARFWMIAVPAPGPDDLLSEIVEASNGVDNLDLLPPQSRDAVLALMERAVAIVNTSDFEGMPQTMLEGWARGRPALALVQDPDGVIGRNGLGFFAHGSVDQLANSARELWDSIDVGESEFADRCRRYVQEHHSSTSVANGWLAVLARANARSRGSVG